MRTYSKSVKKSIFGPINIFFRKKACVRKKTYTKKKHAYLFFHGKKNECGCLFSKIRFCAALPKKHRKKWSACFFFTQALFLKYPSRRNKNIRSETNIRFIERTIYFQKDYCALFFVKKHALKFKQCFFSACIFSRACFFLSAAFFFSANGE